ncbi:unnamed protein product [Rhodiola kirilowii]
MASENDSCGAVEEQQSPRRPSATCMQKFRLYKTQSNFYMIGSDKSRAHWRVLKIDRSEPSELKIREDSTTYSETECSDLLRRIHEGNRPTGGLTFVTICYGIIGFIKFLGPYYMLLVTQRRIIGKICGHSVYAVSKSEIIPLPNSSVWCRVGNPTIENRYKKLLCTVDLTKDFFFSYSYCVMRSLQKNLCDNNSGQVPYDSMFVWNEFLTRGIRNHLQNTIWTVALVHGFFKQATLPISGREFKITLIARRSRHYAGTRYLKRGVNEKGRVANDVETEQIVFQDVPGELPLQISSVVQNRGSIPLFWSQETSRLNLRPNIILSKRDQNYQATRLHFENLVKRYGNPIIILNLIKTQEKKPRESILRAEFAYAIRAINKDLVEENRLKFIHWDLNKHSRRANVLQLLRNLAANALRLTSIFHCRIEPVSVPEGHISWPFLQNIDIDSFDQQGSCVIGSDDAYKNVMLSPVKALQLQKGVLRTNCIDCLDRTNVAQYAYGLVALGHQLHAIGLIDAPAVDLDTPSAVSLMDLYERMGDTLAHQYGGSAAHNKIFCARRGQWRAATQSQEFFRTLQRYYSNAYMDAEKQDAINVFLGHFQPQEGKPALWEMDSDHHYIAGSQMRTDKKGRSFQRSLSDGNILREGTNANQGNFISATLADQSRGSMLLSESSPEISTSERSLTYSRQPSIKVQRVSFESEHFHLNEYDDDASTCSNFVDLDWLSSSANSFEESYERSLHGNTSFSRLSSEYFVGGINRGSTPSSSGYGSSLRGREATYQDGKTHQDVLEEYPESFVQWVTSGETLCH